MSDPLPELDADPSPAEVWVVIRAYVTSPVNASPGAVLKVTAPAATALGEAARPATAQDLRIAGLANLVAGLAPDETPPA